MESTNFGKNVVSNVVHCPFNISHTMPRKTLIMHLTKCPDKKADYSICQFNYQHVVETSNLVAHNAQCPNRLDFDQIVYQTSDSNRREVTLTGPVVSDDLDETWDSETTSVPNVIKTINQTPCFMKPPVGYTKSERKKFRMEAHKAYRDVDLSYKPGLSINKRVDSSTSSGGKNVNQGNQQVKNNGLFFGNRPNT